MTLAEEAIRFAKQHKIEISRRLTDPKTYPPSESPITIFMAGSPGAGKTEFSKNIPLVLSKNPQYRLVRIDSDELRSEIPGYTGSNSSEVQGAVSILLREMYERTLINRQAVIIDGTFSNYEKAIENINRSLKRKRKVFIFYLYQHPEVAWQFTVAREKVEGRNIPNEVFIRQFIQARETVNQIHKNFQERVTIFIVKKDFRTNHVESIDVIRANDSGLDEYIQETYTEEQLKEIL